MPREEDEDRGTFSSPACSMHEFADELVPPRDRASDWSVVKPWRARVRATLLARRTALAPRDRRARGERARRHLLEAFDLAPFRVLAIYWPIRAEIDVRDIATRHIEAGGVAALPVVTRKN